MPIFTSTPYDKAYFRYQYFLPENLVFITTEAINQNYVPLDEYMKNGGNPYEKIDWEYAVEVSAPNINNGQKMTLIFEGTTTLLHPLVIYGESPMINKLAEYNVDFNQSGTFTGEFNGWKPVDGTPLHVLLYYNDTTWEVVLDLLEHGALPNITNSSGQDALEVAKEEGNADLANLISDYMQTHEMSFEKITPEAYQASLHDNIQEEQEVTPTSAPETTPPETSSWSIWGWFTQTGEADTATLTPACHAAIMPEVFVPVSNEFL